MGSATLHRINMDSLQQRAPGYAYVVGVAQETDQTVVTLSYATGDHVEVVFPWLLSEEDRGVPTQFRHVLSAQVRTVEDLECVALGTTGKGPQRMPISLRQAVALAESGVHTVFMTRCAPGARPTSRG